MRTIALLVIASLLAGCTDDAAPAKTLTMEDCLAEGMMLGEVDGKGACVPEPSALTVSILSIDTAGTAYQTMNFSWQVETHRPEAHTMLTQVRISMEDSFGMNLSDPEGWGTAYGEGQHIDFTNSGHELSGSFVPTEGGTYFARAYAEAYGKHIWSDQIILDVTPLQPSGNAHTVAIRQGATALGLAEGEEAASIDLGDELYFDNADLVDYVFSVTGPATMQDFTVSSEENYGPLLLSTPGSYTFSTSSGVQPFSVAINVLNQS